MNKIEEEIKNLKAEVLILQLMVFSLFDGNEELVKALGGKTIKIEQWVENCTKAAKEWVEKGK